MKLLRRAANLAISAALVVISAVNKMLQHRHAGTVFRTAGALMFTVMAIGLFPAASEVMLVAPEGGAAVEKAAEARPQIMVIYRDTPGSEWALAAARRLAAELSDRYNYEAVLTPATQVGFGDPDDEGGAIVIGHTDLSESDYADAYYAVGANGCRTYFNSRGDLILESFGSEGAEAGIDLFLTNYNGDAASAVVQRSGVDVPDLDAVLSNYGGFDYSSASQDDSSAVELKTDSDDGEFRTLVLASPDSNAYSVRAVSALLDSTKPDLVVFMGDLSSGASDRASLIGAWDTIIAPVNERGIGERHIAWNFHDVNALFAFAKHVVRLVSGVGESLHNSGIVEGDIVFHDRQIVRHSAIDIRFDSGGVALCAMKYAVDCAESITAADDGRDKGENERDDKHGLWWVERSCERRAVDGANGSLVDLFLFRER